MKVKQRSFVKTSSKKKKKDSKDFYLVGELHEKLFGHLV